jgi:hypothetical protein
MTHSEVRPEQQALLGVVLVVGLDHGIWRAVGCA